MLTLCLVLVLTCSVAVVITMTSKAGGTGAIWDLPYEVDGTARSWLILSSLFLFLSGSAKKYADLVYNPGACSTHFGGQRSAAHDCVNCVRAVLTAPTKLAVYALAQTSPTAASVVAHLARPASCLAVASAAIFAARAFF